MSGERSSLLQWMDGQHDEEIMALQRAAYERATQVIEERRPVIEAVGRELCENRWGTWKESMIWLCLRVIMRLGSL